MAAAKSSRARWMPTVALAVVALVQLALGLPLRAKYTGGLALAVGGATAAGVDVAGLASWLTRRLSGAISWLAAGLLFLVTVLPAWCWTTLVRRPPIASGDGWVEVRRSAERPSSLGTAAAEPPLPVWARLTWSVGAIVLLLAVDFGVGWAWDASRGTYRQPPRVEVSRNGRVVPRDPLADSPALASAPWAEDFFRETSQVNGTYWPFTESRPLPFRGRYLNIDGWDRRSYQPSITAGAEVPVVWFMGSSTTFGIGQRDGHTIASAFARLAEAEGMPVKVRNFGQRGWVHFQEMFLYESLLADRRPPEFSVFIDGANEVAGQALTDAPRPWILLGPQYAKGLEAAGIKNGGAWTQPVSDRADDPGDVLLAYSRHSAVKKAVSWLTETLPAGAEGKGSDDEFGRTQTGRRALEVYDRGRALSLALSKRYDVDPLFVWQPFEYVVDSITYVRAHLTPPTVDIADALDGHEAYFIDGLHTNEAGARLVAEAIWEQMRPKVEQWYRTH